MSISKTKLLFWMFIGCLFLTSCSKQDDIIDFVPMKATNTIIGVCLSLQDTNGQPYSYEQLLSDKAFSVYGMQSKQPIPVSIVDVKELGEKRLKFDADLPDARYMNFNSTHTNGEGFGLTRLTIDGSEVELRFFFSYSQPEDKWMLANSGLSIELIYCNGVWVKPKSTKMFRYQLLTLRKNSKGGFDIVE